MKSRTPVLAWGVMLVASACSRGEQAQARPDSTVLALTQPVDSPAVVSPQELPPAPAPAPAPPPQASSPKPRPAAPPPAPPPPPAAQPAPPPAPQPPPPPPAPPQASVGTEIVTNSSVEITTRRNKVGETFTARVVDPVVDASGREVIPAGAMVTFRITALKEAENKDAQGILALLPVSVAFGDQTRPITADVSDLQYELKGRGVTAGDAGKVAAGAAIGAVVGQILTKKSSGTVVGGAVGAAAGTAIAVKSADKDIVVPAGARIVVKLTEAFTRS